MIVTELAGSLAHDTRNARPFDLILERAEALAKAARQWEASVAEIADSHTARRADDFLSQLTAEQKQVNAEKEVEKRPHLNANKEIELRYGPVALMLAKAKAIVEPKARAWLIKQREANPDTRPRTRGSYSSKARSLRTHWYAEVDDPVLAFVEYQDHPDVITVLQRLASADARAGVRVIPGCRVCSREIAA